jgi:hypothetical protein
MNGTSVYSATCRSSLTIISLVVFADLCGWANDYLDLWTMQTYATRDRYCQPGGSHCIQLSIQYLCEQGNDHTYLVDWYGCMVCESTSIRYALADCFLRPTSNTPSLLAMGAAARCGQALAWAAMMGVGSSKPVSFISPALTDLCLTYDSCRSSDTRPREPRYRYVEQDDRRAGHLAVQRSCRLGLTHHPTWFITVEAESHDLTRTRVSSDRASGELMSLLKSTVQQQI